MQTRMHAVVTSMETMFAIQASYLNIVRLSEYKQQINNLKFLLYDITHIVVKCIFKYIFRIICCALHIFSNVLFLVSNSKLGNIPAVSCFKYYCQRRGVQSGLCTFNDKMISSWITLLLKAFEKKVYIKPEIVISFE